jgi:hypothetical protein
MSGEVEPGQSFYRGDVLNRMPRQVELLRETAIQEHVLKGWMPDKPFIGPDSTIVAFGSCFASNIGNYLHNLGFDIATARQGRAYVQMIADGLVNVFAICQQFEWAWENIAPSAELWHGWKGERFEYDEEVRLATKALFDKADVFILTFGLSEIWYDELTGGTFWRAIPKGKFDKTRHKFRVATSAETAERLRRIYDLIRKHRPQATIVFTLSPIGLAASFRPVSCISANSVSKAVLRAAIDEVHRSVDDPNFFYFPAYEVVMNGFRTPFGSDLRHVHDYILKANMKAFEHYFCTTGLSETDLQKEIREALDADGAVTTGDRDRFRAFVEMHRRQQMNKEEASAVERELLLKRSRSSLAGRAAAAHAAISSALAACWAATLSAVGATRTGGPGNTPPSRNGPISKVVDHAKIKHAEELRLARREARAAARKALMAERAAGAGSKTK